MTEAQEQPTQRKSEMTEIPDINRFFSNEIPVGIQPNPEILKKWFQLFDDLGLHRDKIRSIKEELTIAHVLKQALASDNQNPYQGVSFKNMEDLTSEGIDVARIARYLILLASYPSGIELNNPQITLSLEEENIKPLIEAIKVIPGYKRLDKQMFVDIIKGLGFMDNKAGGNYVLRLNSEGFTQFLISIANTEGVLRSDR